MPARHEDFEDTPDTGSVSPSFDFVQAHQHFANARQLPTENIEEIRGRCCLALFQHSELVVHHHAPPDIDIATDVSCGVMMPVPPAPEGTQDRGKFVAPNPGEEPCGSTTALARFQGIHDAAIQPTITRAVLVLTQR